MSTTITLDEKQLELVQREMLKCAAQDLRNASKDLDRLANVSPWPVVLADDVRNAITVSRESLDVLDQIGWPAYDAEAVS